ncbi:MAG: hypothetical protein ABJO67_10625 [Pseudoruegeria sp.]
MNKLKKLHLFKEDENGAVSVDWVVLTAALVAMTIAILPAVFVGVDNTADNMEASFDSNASFAEQGKDVVATTVGQ